MRTYFRKISDVLASPLAQAAKAFRPGASKQNRVLRSTRLEDMAYSELRQGDAGLDDMETSCESRLSTFPELCRDVYQSFYSLNVRKNPDEALSETAARFNAPILDEVMQSDDYPVIKAACEGRKLPAYEAAGEFISRLADNLDGLLERAAGGQKALDTLERLEQKRDQSMEQLQKELERMENFDPDPELEKKVLAAANRAQSQCNQANAVRRMVQDSLITHQDEIKAIVTGAVRAAAGKAEETASTLMAWGSGPDTDDPKTMETDRELLERVSRSQTLMEIARHLGRLKELMDCKRRNGYAYGRGEKYSIELGGDLSRALASEFALLASPDAAPLFLRKLQCKGLKQYLRREPVCKGGGNIICMLDESQSAAGQAPWCKAVALALLDIAMRDGRRFAMIHFAGDGDFKTDLFLPGQYDREDVLRAAETFLGGNTDYATPLREALRLMEQEGFEQADMVFVTDGACLLSEEHLEQFKQEQSRHGFQITGILLDQEAGGFDFSLRPFCTEVFRTSELEREQIAERLLTSRIV